MDDLKDQINEKAEADSIIKSIRFPEKSSETINLVIERIVTNMNRKFPNLNLIINRKIKATAGISSNIPTKWKKFSDSEIVSMVRMKKYLEK
jgi:RNA processing factor Prp31